MLRPSTFSKMTKRPIRCHTRGLQANMYTTLSQASVSCDSVAGTVAGRVACAVQRTATLWQTPPPPLALAQQWVGRDACQRTPYTMPGLGGA